MQPSVVAGALVEEVAVVAALAAEQKLAAARILKTANLYRSGPGDQKNRSSRTT